MRSYVNIMKTQFVVEVEFIVHKKVLTLWEIVKGILD